MHTKELKTKFLQNVIIEFNNDQIPTENEFKNLDTVISVKMISKNTYELKIGKEVKELLKFIINYDIKRFTCEDADLEEIFLQYYK